MLSSRLFWKLLLVCAVFNLLAAVAFGYMFARGWTWMLAVLVIVGVLSVSAWILLHIIRPIASVGQMAEAMAAGNYGRRAFVPNRDELGTLARTFDSLRRDLEARAAQLDQSGDRQSTVLGGMIEGVIAVDWRQRVVLANPAAGRLFDFSPMAAEGRPLLEVVRNHALHKAVTTALSTGQPQRLETKSTIPHAASGGQHPTATVQYVEIHVQPLPGEPCPGVVLVMHDTTELRRLESIRRDFVANVSHELKTPLSAIKAYAETLRNGALTDPETARRFLARIEEQADRLHGLIMDMLMLARIESDQQTFEIVSVDVAQVAAACLEDRRASAEAKRIRLSIEPQQLPCRVRADREGLCQIFDNLIDNAIKYTPEGGQVTVAWHCDPSNAQDASASAETPLVRIMVRDTGIGIRPEDQRRVFERFYRVDKARSRELGGTGLGLAIVKHLAQAFSGRVSVESEVGRGSTFIVELPAA